MSTESKPKKIIKLKVINPKIRKLTDSQIKYAPPHPALVRSASPYAFIANPNWSRLNRKNNNSSSN